MRSRAAWTAISPKPSLQSARTTPILVLDVGDVDGCVCTDHGLGYALTANAPYKELEWRSEYVRTRVGGD